jgi:hypothetical protein
LRLVCDVARENKKASVAVGSLYYLVATNMAAVQDITIESEFSEVDAFLNAEAANAKELGLEAETAVEARHLVCLSQNYQTLSISFGRFA